jgi:hypothetical protein
MSAIRLQGALEMLSLVRLPPRNISTREWSILLQLLVGWDPVVVRGEPSENQGKVDS